MECHNLGWNRIVIKTLPFEQDVVRLDLMDLEKYSVLDSIFETFNAGSSRPFVIIVNDDFFFDFKFALE